MVCFAVKAKYELVFLSRPILFEIIRFKIIAGLVIKQNLLDLAAKVEFVKMSTPQKKAQSVSWFIETKKDI